MSNHVITCAYFNVFSMSHHNTDKNASLCMTVLYLLEAIFPSPAKKSPTKLFLAGNNFIIISAGDGKIANLFLQCSTADYACKHFPALTDCIGLCVPESTVGWARYKPACSIPVGNKYRCLQAFRVGGGGLRPVVQTVST